MAATHQKILVWVFCVEREKASFLLLKTTAKRGGFWQPVTGSVEAGEEPLAAAGREMREETGLEPLRIEPVSRPYEFEGRRGERVMEYPFLAEVLAGSRERIVMDRREHVEFQWVSGEQALERIKYPSNARVLRDVLEQLSGQNRKERK